MTSELFHTIALALLSFAAADSSGHSYLAQNSAWPVTHHDVYASQATPLRGLEYSSKNTKIDTFFGTDVAGSLTLLYSSDGKVLWGSSYRSVFKVKRSPLISVDTDLQPAQNGKKTLPIRHVLSSAIQAVKSQTPKLLTRRETLPDLDVLNTTQRQRGPRFSSSPSSVPFSLIASLPKSPKLRSQDTFRGIYCALSKDDIYYASVANRLAAFTNSIPGDSLSGIEQLPGTFVLPSDVRYPDEHIIAVQIAFDGSIIFASSAARVGVLSPRLEKLHDLVAINTTTFATDLVQTERVLYPHETDDLQETIPSFENATPLNVSNSIALDEYGGIYLVSSRFMHRLHYDAFAKRLSAPFLPSSRSQRTLSTRRDCKSILSDHCNVWTSSYGVSRASITGRVTQSGSGTTPTLFRDVDTRRLFVTIADGSVKQKVVVYDALTGRLSGAASVDFGNPSESAYTEQSIVAHEGKLLTVQNALTPSAVRINQFMELLKVEERVQGLPETIRNNVYLFPVLLGDSPKGIQQLKFNFSETDPQKRLQTTWINRQHGCPSSVPVLSIASNLVYCQGRGRHKEPASSVSDVRTVLALGEWTIQAFDWHTGERKFAIRVGKGIRYNALYAAVQIGLDEEIVHGTVGGFVRIRRFPLEQDMIDHVAPMTESLNFKE